MIKMETGLGHVHNQDGSYLIGFLQEEGFVPVFWARNTEYVTDLLEALAQDCNVLKNLIGARADLSSAWKKWDDKTRNVVICEEEQEDIESMRIYTDEEGLVEESSNAPL